MKKIIVTMSIVSLLTLSGGVMTALANEDEQVQLQSVEATASFNEYTGLNNIIKRNWANLSTKQKERYLKNPKPDAFFPFGIDVDAKYPIGYPDCDKASYPASYKQTAKLPTLCF